MAVTVAPTGSSNDSPTLQAALNANDDIELVAGGVYNIPTVLEIPSSTRLFSDHTNPATLKRTEGTIRTTIPNGNGIRIENLKFDWNMGGVWKPFHSHIALSPPGGSGITASSALGDIWIIGCQFIESTSSGAHTNNDSWCISMTAAVATQNITGFKILGCRSDSNVQLVGNGTINGTWSDVEIAFNQASNGQNAAIGFSSLTTTSASTQTVFNNINIHHNFLRGFRGLGIFIGQDNGATADGTVTLTNIKVNDNLLEPGILEDFPICVLIRPGRAAGYLAAAECNRNVFSVLDSLKNGDTPRPLQFNGETTGNTLTFNNNRLSGVSSVITENVAVTATGNKFLDGTVWSV